LKIICIKENRATSSTVFEVSAGDPQGSVLVPLLFLTYINDIGGKLLFLSRLFADDTSLGYSSQNVVEIAAETSKTVDDVALFSLIQIIFKPFD
jgi:hypothetical protein